MTLTPENRLTLRFTSSHTMKREEVLETVRSHREALEQLGVKSLELFGSVARELSGIRLWSRSFKRCSPLRDSAFGKWLFVLTSVRLPGMQCI